MGGSQRDVLALALDMAVSAWLRDLANAHAAGLHTVAAAIAQRIADAQLARDALD